MRSDIPLGWNEVKLENITTKIGSGATPRGGSRVYLNQGVTFIRSQNVLDYSFDANGLVYIGDAHADQLESVTVQENDILLNITGDSVARACLVPTDRLPARVNQHVSIIRVDPSVADHRYLLYELQFLKQHLLSYSHSGATRKALTKAMIANLTILLPPLATQKAIAYTLSCLDAKIEVNNKIIRNLEEQAQAIFKNWFIDFEPFQEGEFVESELGTIPKGWEVVSLSQMVSETRAGDWGIARPEGKNTEKVYCIRGADIPDVRAGKKAKMPVRYILRRNLENKRLEPNDIVIEMSGGSPTQSTGRAVKISSHLLTRYDEDLVCTNFCRALSVKKPYATFLYRHWIHFYDTSLMFAYENGTTGIKNFDLDSFLTNVRIVVPPVELLSRYYDFYDAFEESIYSLSRECDVLANLRDTLLPKLMSGEIEVPIDQ
ncbi:MAG: restriction endonuclease subunit S [Limnochordia bacterium]|nr:restriction endonuclease subunit S [Limnochordia bacterium]